MGLFDVFKKKKKVEEEKDEEPNLSGWNAIIERCEQVYPNQKDPQAFGPIIRWRFGGGSPLDSVRIYDGGDYWHFVTLGLSELYEKRSKNKEISGYGWEFTFKLKKGCYEDEYKELLNATGTLQHIAKTVFENGEIYGFFEYLYSGQTEGLNVSEDSEITGFITVPDFKLKEINTPNGKVKFIELIGATNRELEAIMSKKIDVIGLCKKLGNDVTDYRRKSVI